MGLKGKSKWGQWLDGFKSGFELLHPRYLKKFCPPNLTSLTKFTIGSNPNNNIVSGPFAISSGFCRVLSITGRPSPWLGKTKK